jgi:hypothetical protein
MGTSEEKEVSRASAHQGLIEVSSTLIALSDGHPSQRGSKSLTGANYVAALGLWAPAHVAQTRSRLVA